MTVIGSPLRVAALYSQRLTESIAAERKVALAEFFRNHVDV